MKKTKLEDIERCVVLLLEEQEEHPVTLKKHTIFKKFERFCQTHNIIIYRPYYKTNICNMKSVMIGDLNPELRNTLLGELNWEIKLTREHY